MPSPLHLPGALWQLFRMAAATRFRLRGKYWRWRNETAFGSDPARWPGRSARWDAILEYANWVGRMKRMRS